MSVDLGTVIVFTVQGTTGPYLPRSVDSVRQVVIDNLTPFFDVQNVAFTTDSFLSDPLHYLSNWPYSATVQIRTRVEYADIQDVDDVIAHAFYEGTGELPTVTANGIDVSQGASDTKQGFSVSTVIVFAVVALIAVAVIKGESLLK